MNNSCNLFLDLACCYYYCTRAGLESKLKLARPAGQRPAIVLIQYSFVLVCLYAWVAVVTFGVCWGCNAKYSIFCSHGWGQTMSCAALDFRGRERAVSVASSDG